MQSILKYTNTRSSNKPIWVTSLMRHCFCYFVMLIIVDLPGISTYYSPRDGRPVDHKVIYLSISSSFPDNLAVPIYTPGWREALWGWSAQEHNTLTRPGLEPRPLYQESSALINLPQRFPIRFQRQRFFISKFL